MNRAAIFLCTIPFLFLPEALTQEAGRTPASATALDERVFYEIFIQSFYDSDRDGIGDLKGVTEKLDYLADLGITGLWLLPVHPSPSYHKYDVTDYYGIHPDYGTLSDMKTLLQEAHKRNMIVLIDMVINHSSDQHAFFRESIKDRENPFRGYYVWSHDPRVTGSDAQHWHQINGDDEQYYGFFWKGMPDFNFDNAAVREEMKKIGAYWLGEVGVDGFRLDAAKYIYPDSLYGKNVAWWQEYKSSLDSVRKDHFLVAEIWDDAGYIAPFLNGGVDAAFNFEVSFAIEKMLSGQTDPGLGHLLAGIRERYAAVSTPYHDAIFLKNHDQDRVMSLLADPRQSELAASVLLTLPGIPFLYYGEEIGMLGKKPDEHIREPMVWDLPGKDPGQTRWIEPVYSVPGKVVPVSQQLSEPHSLISHYKNLIALRRQYPVLATGSISGLNGMPDGLCGYILSDENRKIFVVHNLTGRQKEVDAIPGGTDVKILYLSGSCQGTAESLCIPPYGTLIRSVED